MSQTPLEFCTFEDIFNELNRREMSVVIISEGKGGSNFIGQTTCIPSYALGMLEVYRQLLLDGFKARGSIHKQVE